MATAPAIPAGALNMAFSSKNAQGTARRGAAAENDQRQRFWRQYTRLACRYRKCSWSIASRHPALSCARFRVMQAVIFATSGTKSEQSRMASPVHACRASSLA
jgi:hypothetical protein